MTNIICGIISCISCFPQLICYCTKQHQKYISVMVFNERNLLVHLVVLCISWELCHTTRQQRALFLLIHSYILYGKGEDDFKELIRFCWPSFFFFFPLYLPCLMLKKLLLVSKYMVHIFLTCTKGQAWRYQW